MAKKRKTTKLGQGLLQGLREINDWQEGKIELRSTHVELPDDPPSMDKKTVKKIREEILHLSQPVLAKYLGVSDKAVKAWEQGLSKPNGSAVRLLQIALIEPQSFSAIILTAAKKGA